MSISGNVTSAVGLGVFRRVDAVLSCLDNREARLHLSRFCWQAGVPMIDGSLGIASPFYGGVRVFLPPRGPCYGCTLSLADYQALGAKYSCQKVGDSVQPSAGAATTPIEASIIGAMQVQEVVKFLHEPRLVSSGGRFYNGLRGEMFSVAYERRDDCPAHQESYAGYPQRLLPQRMGEMTGDMLLSLARSSFGPEAKLRLPQNIITGWSCVCGNSSEPVYRVEAELDPVSWTCPHCLSRRHARLVYVVEHEGQLGQLTLASLGMPPLSGVVVEHPSGEAYFEVAGDEKDFWRFS